MRILRKAVARTKPAPVPRCKKPGAAPWGPPHAHPQAPGGRHKRRETHAAGRDGPEDGGTKSEPDRYTNGSTDAVPSFAPKRRFYINNIRRPPRRAAWRAWAAADPSCIFFKNGIRTGTKNTPKMHQKSTTRYEYKAGRDTRQGTLLEPNRCTVWFHSS